MPLINHTQEFLSKQAAKKARDEHEAKAAQEAEYSKRTISLIEKQLAIQAEFNALDITKIEDRAAFDELRSRALTEGIPLVKFFSPFQYELILQMIRAVRLHSEIADHILRMFDVNIYTETEEIIDLCYHNIRHLNQLVELGEIGYKEQYIPKRKSPVKATKSNIWDDPEPPEQYEARVKEFLNSFFNKDTNNE